MNKEVIGNAESIKDEQSQMIFTPGFFKNAIWWAINRKKLVKYIDDHGVTRFLVKSLNRATGGSLLRKLAELQNEKIKRTLDPGKKTIVICLTTRAYRGNLGNVVDKLRNTCRYNIVIVYGEVISDQFEQQKGAFYMHQLWLDSLDVADVVISVRPFHGPLPAGKLVYFLHDIHDSAIGDIEANFRLVLDFDYYMLSSRFLVERLQQQIAVGKQHYPGAGAKERRIGIIGGGYPRLDSNIEYFEKHQQSSKTLIFATTAILGPDLAGLVAFPAHADKVIAALLKEFPDYDVIFRPHPLTTDRPEVRHVAKKYGGHPRFAYDDNGSYYMPNYSKAVLMITDMSGTAYTYAFTTLRPVVFFSPNEPEVMKRFGNYQYFKDRHKVGYVAENIGEMVEKIRLLLATKDEFSPGIREYRDSIVYNIGKSEDYFVDNIEYILQDKKHPDWIYV